MSEKKVDARRKAGRWVSLIAYVVGFVWLYVASTPEITGSFSEGERRQFRVMAVKAAEQSARPEYVTMTLGQLGARGDDRSRMSFLLPGKTTEIPGGDLHRATVLESHTDWQLIRYDYGNTHTSVSRYRAFRDRVEPVSYRVTFHPGLLIGAVVLLVPAWLAGLAAGWIAKRVWK